MLQLLPLLLRALPTGLRSRRDLALENLVLRHQLHVVLRTNPNPGLRNRDRVLWVWVRLLWPKGWRQHLLIVQPETVLRWHRKGWRLYWTWKSRTRLGRPRLSREVRDLIAPISQQNRLWGTERIRGELLKLGFVVSKPAKPHPKDEVALSNPQPRLTPKRDLQLMPEGKILEH